MTSETISHTYTIITYRTTRDEQRYKLVCFGLLCIRYSRTSLPRTPMAPLPWLIRTRF